MIENIRDSFGGLTLTYYCTEDTIKTHRFNNLAREQLVPDAEHGDDPLLRDGDVVDAGALHQQHLVEDFAGGSELKQWKFMNTSDFFENTQISMK